MAAKLVTCTNVNQEKASRYDIVNWVNSLVGTQYTKIEQMATGGAYCRLLDILWPGTIPVKRVKMDTVLEHEFIENFKIVQAAFSKHGIDAWMPIEKLVKARFQDNFEFAQWFKKFFDANYGGQPIAVLPPAANTAAGSTPQRNNVQKTPAARQQRAASLRNSGQPLRSPPKSTDGTPQAGSDSFSANMSSSASAGTQQRVRELESRITEQQSSLDEMEHLRTFYFTKLRLVEILAQQCCDSGAKTVEAQRILDILYAENHPDAADLD